MKLDMKNMMRKNISNLMMAAALAAILSACAQGNDTPTAVLSPISTSGTGSLVPTAPGSTTSANSATLTTSSGALAAMFFNSGANNPSNEQFSMSVSNSGNGYAGTATISYTDNSGSHTATLSTTHPSYTSTSDAEYNVWLNSTQWHGFFQDLYGAIVVVVNGSTSTGDGAVGTLSGSIYFQNFGQSGVQGPLKMCWQITIGPYDCRTFLGSVDNKSYTLPQTYSALAPNNSGPNRPAYQLLGTFQGLSQSAAFGD